MHVASVYTAAETAPRHADIAHQLQDNLDGYLAQIGEVPWIAGGGCHKLGCDVGSVAAP